MRVTGSLLPAWLNEYMNEMMKWKIKFFSDVFPNKANMYIVEEIEKTRTRDVQRMEKEFSYWREASPSFLTRTLLLFLNTTQIIQMPEDEAALIRLLLTAQ